MPITTPEQLALAKRVRNQVKARPEQHEQAYWHRHRNRCGTTACIAGWTAILDGAELIVKQDGFGSLSEEVRTHSGAIEKIPDYAQRALGLGHEVNELFYCDDEEAVRYLEQLIADAEARLSGASV